LGLLNRCCDLLVEFVESAPQWAGELGEVGKNSAQAGTQESVIDAGEEQGDAQAEVGESVTMRAGDALKDRMQSKPPQKIAICPAVRALGD
jgi:hypothetical protein